MKMHFACHLAMQSKYANPRHTWTYMDEDFMGLIKLIAEACSPGTPAHAIVLKLCSHYLAGMSVRAILQDE